MSSSDKEAAGAMARDWSRDYDALVRLREAALRFDHALTKRDGQPDDYSDVSIAWAALRVAIDSERGERMPDGPTLDEFLIDPREWMQQEIDRLREALEWAAPMFGLPGYHGARWTPEEARVHVRAALGPEVVECG